MKVAGNAADYGLDQPQFKVQVDAAGKSVKLNVGRNVKAGNELYVQVEGSDVAQVVSADLLDKLDVKPDKLRLTRLVDADSMVARSLTIARPKDPVVLDKTGEQWRMSLPTTQPAGASPTTLPAEASAVTDVLSALSNAQATGFADPGDNEAMLVGEPRATVTVGARPPTTQPDGRPPADSVTIAFGSPDSLVGKNVWVRVTPGGVVATVSKETMDSVLKSPLDFRNREVVKVDPSAVTAVRVVKTVPAATQPTTRAGERACRRARPPSGTSKPDRRPFTSGVARHAAVRAPHDDRRDRADDTGRCRDATRPARAVDAMADRRPGEGRRGRFQGDVTAGRAEPVEGDEVPRRPARRQAHRRAAHDLRRDDPDGEGRPPRKSSLATPANPPPTPWSACITA